VLLTWEDYMAEEVLRGFQEATGIEVIYETFETGEELEARLQSDGGRYDLVILDGLRMASLIELQLLRELDHDALSNRGNIESRFLDLHFDPGNRFTFPYTWGSTLVAYRSDKLDNVKESWSSLWDESYQDRVYLLDDPVDCLYSAFYKRGADVSSLSPQTFEDARVDLLDLVDKIRPVFSSDEGVRDALRSGDAWIAQCYSGDAAMLASEGVPLSWFIPEEGAPLWVDNFAIPRDSKQPEAAHRFINFLLTAEAAAANSNYLWCATPNEAAVPFFDEELKADQTIYPPQNILALCKFPRSLTLEQEKLANETWRHVRTASKAGFAAVKTIASP